MIGAESQFVLDMYDKNGTALAGNDSNIATATSDGGPTENGGVAADSVPTLAKSHTAAAAATATVADGSNSSATTSITVKREMDDSTPKGIAPSTTTMEMARLPAAKLDTAATMDGAGDDGVVRVAAKIPAVVKHEMDESPTLDNNESSAMTKERDGDIGAPAACVNPVAVKHEMDYSSTPSDESPCQKAATRAPAVVLNIPKPVEQTYRMRNVMLAGMSSNHIRDGQTKTTFSIYDFGFTSETL
jgi:hypothetical protein